VKSLAELTGRSFSDDQANEIRASQLAGYCKTFLWYGMTNGVFAGYMGALSEPAKNRLAEAAARFA
jgi:hypothetical protein